MKRLIVGLVLAVAIALALAACGSDSSGSGAAKPTTTTEDKVVVRREAKAREALGTAATAQTLGEFSAGSQIMAPGSLGARKWAALTNEYTINFTNNNVSQKKIVGRGRGSITYCNVESDNTCNFFREISAIKVDPEGKVTDFAWSVGTTKAELTPVTFLAPSAPIVWTNGVISYELVSGSITGRETCYLVRFVNSSGDSEYAKIDGFQATTSDGISVASTSSSDSFNDVSPGNQETSEVCFQYDTTRITGIVNPNEFYLLRAPNDYSNTVDVPAGAIKLPTASLAVIG